MVSSSGAPKPTPPSGAWTPAWLQALKPRQDSKPLDIYDPRAPGLMFRLTAGGTRAFYWKPSSKESPIRLGTFAAEPREGEISYAEAKAWMRNLKEAREEGPVSFAACVAKIRAKFPAHRAEVVAARARGYLAHREALRVPRDPPDALANELLRQVLRGIKNLESEVAKVRAHVSRLNAATRREPARGDARRLGISEVSARLGINGRTVDKWTDAGRFPAPHYIAGMRRWHLHEVEDWERANSSDKGPGMKGRGT